MPDVLKYNQEVYRKCIHMSSSIIAILLWILGKDVFLPFIMSATIFFLIIDYLRIYIRTLEKFYSTLFGSVTRHYEYHRFSGASWVFIGSAATIFLFNEKVAIISLLVMSLSDSAAAIIGIKYGRTYLFNKSLEGSSAFFITSSIIIISLSPALFIVNIIAVLTSVVIELLSTPVLNDNLFIPVATGIILTVGGVV